MSETSSLKERLDAGRALRKQVGCSSRAEIGNTGRDALALSEAAANSLREAG